MIVHKLICPYRSANSYLIEIELGFFIGVDIGNIDIKEITSIINCNNGKLLGYFLTHAHGDHTFGIKKIWDLYKMPIYCSLNTSIDIKDPKRNFSAYSDGITPFSYELPVNIVNDEDKLFFNNSTFNILLTPGHSPGCMIIWTDNVVFTGDFVMKDFKTPLNLPNSSKSDYIASREKFTQKFNNIKCIYYPGHGNDFVNLNEAFKNG